MPAKLKRLCVYICVDLWTVCVSISFYNGNNIKFCFETPSQYTFVNHFVVWIVSVACAISFNRFCERICSWLHSDFVWCVDATKPNEQKKPYDFFGYFDENPIRWHFVRMLICFLFECDCNPFELNNFLFWTTVELLNEFHSIAPNKFVALFFLLLQSLYSINENYLCFLFFRTSYTVQQQYSHKKRATRINNWSTTHFNSIMGIELHSIYMGDWLTWWHE